MTYLLGEWRRIRTALSRVPAQSVRLVLLDNEALPRRREPIRAEPGPRGGVSAQGRGYTQEPELKGGSAHGRKSGPRVDPGPRGRGHGKGLRSNAAMEAGPRGAQ